MATQPPQLDAAKQQAFVRQNLADLAGMCATVLSIWGDRLGLFKALHEQGPADSAELASRASISQRYAREWLCGMACVGYLEYDAATERFTLPPEHAPVLAQEASLPFRGGLYQLLPSWFRELEAVEQAFRHGEGVPQARLADENFWKGYERYRAPRYENQLLQEWLPSLSDVQPRLEQGVKAADVGCGSGQWVIKLARAFPNSEFVGYDPFQPAIELANSQASAARLGDRVRFERWDAAEALPETFDVIFTFDVVHDAARPRELLRSIRQTLKPGGVYVCQDITVADRLEEDLNQISALKFTLSLLYCMTTSLAQGGEGLGTMGLSEARLREYSLDAGFRSVRRTWEDPMYVLYEVRP